MSVLFKTEQDRKDVPYIEFGETFKTRVADLRKLIVKLRADRLSEGKSNIIEVKAIRTKREKELSVVIKYSKDPLTGIHFGIALGTFEDGNVKWRGIYLTDYNTFDISKDYEAQCYVVLMMHPRMKYCPIVTSQDPDFEIVDPDEVAKHEFAKAMKIKSALQKISTMPQDTVEPFARYLDLAVSETMSKKYIKNLLSNAALSDPAQFLNAFDDRNRPLFEMLSMARKFNIIRYDTEHGYMIGKTFMGFTKEDVARKLEEDELLLARLRTKLKDHGYGPESEANIDDDKDKEQED